MNEKEVLITIIKQGSCVRPISISCDEDVCPFQRDKKSHTGCYAFSIANNNERKKFYLKKYLELGYSKKDLLKVLL